MKFSGLLLLLALPFYFISCKPQQKLPNYLERIYDTSGNDTYVVPELRIQKNDLLSIQITSLSTKPDISDAIYNQLPVGASNGSAGNVPGYLVDADGNIQHHRLGTIHVEGLTKKQLAAEIIKRLTEPVKFLEDPSVIIRFMNFQVYVNGEVAHPGAIPAPGERITITQALALAGDVAQFGRRNTVKVVREVDGKRQIGMVDLSSDSLFKSPYYNLVQNDQIFVEAGKIKTKAVEQSIVAQKVSFALTIATVAASIANLFIRN